MEIGDVRTYVQKGHMLSKLMPLLASYMVLSRMKGICCNRSKPVNCDCHTLQKDYIMNLIAFLNDETGAVTVDWVVLTAAVVTLGLVVFNFVSPAVSNLASDIGNEVKEAGTEMKAQQ